MPAYAHGDIPAPMSSPSSSSSSAAASSAPPPKRRRAASRSSPHPIKSVPPGGLIKGDRIEVFKPIDRKYYPAVVTRVRGDGAIDADLDDVSRGSVAQTCAFHFLSRPDPPPVVVKTEPPAGDGSVGGAGGAGGTGGAAGGSSSGVKAEGGKAAFVAGAAGAASPKGAKGKGKGSAKGAAAAAAAAGAAGVPAPLVVDERAVALEEERQAAIGKLTAKKETMQARVQELNGGIILPGGALAGGGAAGGGGASASGRAAKAPAGAACHIPKQDKAHWDNLVAEAIWMSKDFKNERYEEGEGRGVVGEKEMGDGKWERG